MVAIATNSSLVDQMDELGSFTMATMNIDNKIIYGANQMKRGTYQKTGLASKEQYTKRLAVLHNIRDFLELENGGKDAFPLRLPQIIVVGSQSDGKSSLLSCLTDIDFPEKSGICTKAPIVVECTYDASLSSNQYRVRDPGTDEYVACDATSVAKRISDIQDAAICGRNGQELIKVSKTEIRVRVAGPEQMDIIIIDLPGIITNGEGQEETKELVRQYGEPDETLILLVTKAETDEELLPALDLAKEVDPKEARTLRVLTKFDQFGNPDARERAIRLIKAGSMATDHHERSVWGLEPHAVVCRSQMENGSMAYCVKKEIEVLDALPERYVGVAALKRRLPAIFSHLVDINLPKLNDSTASHLHNAKSRLACIGWEPSDPTLVVMECREKLLRCQNDFEEAISRVFLTFEEQIRETGSRVTKEFTDENYTVNIFHVTVFYGENAVKKSLDQIVGWWEPILDTYISMVDDVLAQSLLSLESGNFTSAYPKLAEYMAVKWKEDYSTIVAEFRKKCANILKKERTFGTIKQDFQDNYEFLSEAIDNARPQLELPDLSDCPDERAEEEEDFFRELKEELMKTYTEFSTLSSSEKQKRRVFTVVKNLWEKETHTFVDLIFKETRDSIVGGQKNWAETELCCMLPELREKAVDSDEIARERAALKDVIKRMTKIQEELKSLRDSGCM